jgi:hypothetical protein
LGEKVFLISGRGTDYRWAPAFDKGTYDAATTHRDWSVINVTTILTASKAITRNPLYFFEEIRIFWRLEWQQQPGNMSR